MKFCSNTQYVKYYTSILNFELINYRFTKNDNSKPFFVKIIMNH